MGGGAGSLSDWAQQSIGKGALACARFPEGSGLGNHMWHACPHGHSDRTHAVIQLSATITGACAGLWAQRVAGSIAGIPRSSIPPLYLTKGTYFK